MQESHGPIGTIKPQRPIIIHGAGVAGLLMGYYLKRAGISVKIYEKGSHTGGKIYSHQSEYGPVETAANAIFTNDDVLELMKELSLDFIPATPKLKKKVWRWNSVRSFPLSFFELIRVPFFLFRKAPTKNIAHKSVYDFFKPLFGKKFSSEVIGAVLRGIYATGPEKLNFLAVFKCCPSPGQSYLSYFKMLKAKRNSKNKATSISFEGGMYTFIQALTKKLEPELILEQTAELDTEYNHIICCDARSSANILREQFPILADMLDKINYTTLKTSTFFLSKPIHFLEKSFGVVFPEGSKFNFAGILNNSAIFQRANVDKNVYSYTLISSGDEDLNQLETNFLDFTNSSKNTILFVKHTHWSRAIPLYDIDLYENVLKLRTEILQYQGLVLFGNYTGGISIREMVSSAKQFSKNIKGRAIYG